MRLRAAWVLILLLVGVAVVMVIPAAADSKDPLFVNLTTSSAHRAAMAVSFAQKQHDLGHPVTIFANDRGVFVVALSSEARYAEQQAMLAEMIDAGVTVLACPMCMKHYGVEESDLLEGVTVSSPDVVGNALFQPDTKTLTW